MSLLKTTNARVENFTSYLHIPCHFYSYGNDFICTDVPRYKPAINIFISFKLDAGMVKLHRWSRLKHLLISVMDLSDKNLLIL